jgi:hypothetical protein
MTEVKMKKITILIALTIVSMLLAACQPTEDPKELDEIIDSFTNDL